MAGRMPSRSADRGKAIVALLEHSDYVRKSGPRKFPLNRFVCGPVESSGCRGFVAVESSRRCGFTAVESSRRCGFTTVESSRRCGFTAVESSRRRGFTAKLQQLYSSLALPMQHLTARRLLMSPRPAWRQQLLALALSHRHHKAQRIYCSRKIEAS